MNTLSNSLQKNLTEIKKRLPSEDVLSYTFETADKTACAIVYADGIVNKELLGELVARPLSNLSLGQEMSEKGKNEGGRYALKLEIIQKSALFPEIKEEPKLENACKEILDGNALLLVDGENTGLIIGAKFLPVRAVTEPPTDVTVKGPREGFIEDVKVNMALIRKRLKTPKLQFESMRVGKNSDTVVTLCWLDGTSKEGIKEEIKTKLQTLQIDFIPDSSYIAAFLSPRKHSIFHTIGTTEKPDVFAAKLSEGRVGVLVDGSPIALTAPYFLMEDLQTSEDYFVSPFVATVFRLLRVLALLISLLLPAFYVSAQLYKLQLLPLGLTLTIASSIQELPLSPNLEMFVVLFLLETLKEASIRMPKYVGMSLSVVGALVLGETAVSAGFLSTPAIIVVALSGICLYTVPDFVETGSLLRWLFLLVAGSIGPFGIVLTTAFLLCYLLSANSFGAPALAPFSPLNKRDLRDSIVKYDMLNLKQRPQTFRLKNKTRLAVKQEKEG